MKNNNTYFLIILAIILMLIQGHLAQKLDMLNAYFSNPDYEFFTTFSYMDLFDLFIHGILPLGLIIAAVRNIIKEKKLKSE